MVSNSLSRMTKANREARELAKTFRREYAAGQRTFKEFSIIKQEHPYHGIVKCASGDLVWGMFSASDDVVAWQYFWLGDNGYEDETVRLWQELSRKAKCILDVGGYTGLMSIVSKLVNPGAEVHFFEPMERTFERAQVNFRINGLRSGIHMHNIALSNRNKNQKINLYRHEHFLGTGNSLTEKPDKTIIDVKRIKSQKLTTCLPNIKPDLIKLDVEGHEVQALRGMWSIVQKYKPDFIIEVWPHEADELLGMMTKVGYTFDQLDGHPKGIRNLYATCK